MKIGIDARLLSRPITGIGRYTLEMCRALSKIEDLSLYLYSPSPLPSRYVLDLAVASINNGSWNNGLFRQLWSETYLPMWAKSDGVDIFWGPAHRLPHYLPSSMARVVTIHDLVWRHAGHTMRPLSRILESWQMPFAVDSADAVVANSQSTADALNQEFSINPGKLSMIHLGVSKVINTGPDDVLGLLGVNTPYFLFVGTLEPRKNLGRLLTAYSGLSESIRDKATLVIAGGEGWGRDNIPDMVNRLGLSSHVISLGYVDESMLSALYANALFLAMPSIYEGFGLPIVEATSYGTPVLTASNSSMPEVAGDAGLLVDALDVDSIRAGLSTMISNAKLRNDLAANAKNNAARFNWDESARQMFRVFEKAISSRNSRIS
jgi:glycosyltransferase involved in cell wall biosynthesis